MYNYIQDLKLKVLNEAEKGKSKAIQGKKIDRDEIEAIDNYDTPHQVMIGNDLTDKSEARKLKKEIADFREFLLTLVKEKELPERTEDIDIKKSGYESSHSRKKERNWIPKLQPGNTINSGIHP